MAILDFEKLFQEYIDANQKSWKHDRAKTLGASETFSCIRRSWFVKFGKAAGFVEDEDDPSWGAMERGNIIENHFVVPAIRNHLPPGVSLYFAGSDQNTFVDELNSATPDGIIINLPKNALSKYGVADIKSNCIGLEIKSIDPRVSLDEEKAVHHGQAQMQMGIVRATTLYKPVYTVILYIDASFLDVIYPFVVEFDERKYKAGKLRAKQLFDVGPDGYPGDLRAEGRLGDECKYCPWFGACAAVTVGGVPKKDNSESFDNTVISEMNDLISQERTAKEIREEADAVHEEIRLKIKEFLNLNNTKRMRSGLKKKGSNERSWSVNWSTMNGKETLDKDAVQAAGLDLSPYMKTGSPYDRLTITVK